MQAYEMRARVSAEGRLEVPQDALEMLPRETDVRLIILVPELEEISCGCGRGEAIASDFLEGYGEADAVYDTL